MQQLSDQPAFGTSSAATAANHRLIKKRAPHHATEIPETGLQGWEQKDFYRAYPSLKFTNLKSNVILAVPLRLLHRLPRAPQRTRRHNDYDTELWICQPPVGG